MRKGKLRIIEVVTDTGHVAGKFTRAREIGIRTDGALVIDGRTYRQADLERHLESMIMSIESVLGDAAKRAALAPETFLYRAHANRRELARRINALQGEIRDNGYSTAEATSVLASLRRRLDEWFEPYNRLEAELRAA